MMPHFFEAIQLTWKTCKEEWQQSGPTDMNFLPEFFTEMKHNLYLEPKEIFAFIVIAILFTVLRVGLTKLVFQPLAQKLQFSAKDRNVFPESSFKFLVYLGLYVAECFVLLSQYPEFLTKPESCWTGWKVGMKVPSDIYWIYVTETGFYFHGIYAVIFMDMWRGDSLMLLLHHAVTISLIIFSLALRYHRMGLVVLFLHDIADVSLELTKVIKSFHDSSRRSRPYLSIAITVGFVVFASSWISCRLVAYPILVLYSAGHVGRTVLPHAPFYFFFNGLLWLLFLMNIWWCYFIILLIYRIATGQSKHIEDTREFDTVEGKVASSKENESETILNEEKRLHENSRQKTSFEQIRHNSSTDKISEDDLAKDYVVVRSAKPAPSTSAAAEKEKQSAMKSTADENSLRKRN